MKRFWLIFIALTLPFMATTIIKKQAQPPQVQGGKHEPVKDKPTNDQDTEHWDRW